VRVLSLDTATSVLSVALGTGERLIGETTMIGARDHSVRVFPVIDALLDAAGWEMRSLEGIVVGDGPGSYTGVRIGVTAAKTLGYALRIPVVGVSTLLGMALAFSTFPGIICPMIDARRGRVYTGVYSASERIETANGAGSDLTCLNDEGIYPMERVIEVVQSLRSASQAPVLFLGEGVQRLRPAIEPTLGHCSQFTDESHTLNVRAGMLIRPGIELLQTRDSGAAGTLVPRYMQMVEAEAKMIHREQRNE